MTTKYKVIAVRTQFMWVEVDADSKDEAIDKAWQTDPVEWANKYLSDECEQWQALTQDDDEWQYWGEA